MRFAAILLALLFVPAGAAHVPQVLCEPSCSADPTVCISDPVCFVISVGDLAADLTRVVPALLENAPRAAAHCLEHAQAGEFCDGSPFLQS